ncbi:MAG: L,D-transpeptidase family protein [Woeseiaceae bacterium]|nr:L,D-transpeptidase family protein [Woeseiaceae bacterium]
MRNFINYIFGIIFLICNLVIAANLKSEELNLEYIIDLPNSVDDVLIADTENAKLLHYSVKNKKLSKVKEYYLSIGLNGSDKQLQGDKKTPLGIYFITKELDISKLPSRYGAAAYPLDYPNSLDRYKGKTGYGIWLHGTDPDIQKRPPRATDGCLALQNNELLELSKYLVPMNTPIIVVETISWKTKDQINAIRNEINTVINSWKKSFNKLEKDKFIALYDKDFGYDLIGEIEFFNEFSSANQRMTIENLYVMTDPVDSGIIISRFTQKLRKGNKIINQTKRLYWKKQPAGWRIISTDQI